MLEGALRTIRENRPWIVTEILRRTDHGAMRRILRELQRWGYQIHLCRPDFSQEPEGPDSYRQHVNGEMRTWLLAPQPLDDGFRCTARDWLAAILACNETTNLLVETTKQLPKGWNRNYRAPLLNLRALIPRTRVQNPRSGVPELQATCGAGVQLHGDTVAPRPGTDSSTPPTPRPRPARPGQRTKPGDLTPVRGLVTMICDDLLPQDAARRNLGFVADALEHAEVPYILLRTDGPYHRVALSVQHRAAALAALSKAGTERTLYARVLARKGAHEPIIQATDLHLLDNVPAVRAFHPVSTSKGTLHYGDELGCNVEFWSRDDSGMYQTPGRTTLVGRQLHRLTANATLEIGGRNFPTVDLFTRRLINDVDFPIDAVYLWVDCNDPVWQASRSAHSDGSGQNLTSDAQVSSRFRSRDELRYSLRSLAMYAPWIRRVHLVTDNQKPDWLNDEHPELRVISHTELFKDASCLPTFNSHAIETQLHRIEGLSEHFLYFNDDVFLGRSVQPQNFFQSNGVSRYFPSTTGISMTPVAEDDLASHVGAKNNRALLAEHFGRTLTHTFWHAPHPLLRSVLADVCARFDHQVDRTARTRFRSQTDISICSLYHHYAYLSGRAAPGRVAYAYINTADPDHCARFDRMLRERNYDTFCLNDGEVPHGLTAEEQNEMVREFLRSYFPLRSPYER